MGDYGTADTAISGAAPFMGPSLPDRLASGGPYWTYPFPGDKPRCRRCGPHLRRSAHTESGPSEFHISWPQQTQDRCLPANPGGKVRDRRSQIRIDRHHPDTLYEVEQHRFINVNALGHAE